MDPNTNQSSQVIQNPQSPAPQPQLPPLNSGKRKKIIIAAIVVLILLLVVVGSFIVLSKNSNDTSEQKTTQSPTPSVKPTLIPFPSEDQYVEGELIISYEKDKGPDSISQQRLSEIKSIFQALGVVSEESIYKDTTDPILKNFYLLKFEKGVNIEEVAQEIYKLPEIKGAEPNVEASVFE